MSLTTILGILAAAVSTASFAPQAWKIIRSRKTKDISTGMYLLTVVGFALWIGFGIRLGQWPLIAANSICLLLSGFILLMKLFTLPRKTPSPGQSIQRRRLSRWTSCERSWACLHNCFTQNTMVGQ
jgi:MtN3 and saliva related transmembrane protein